MKFTVSQSALQTALDIVSKGIGSNTTLPILSGIYLKAFNGMLELQSSDLTISKIGRASCRERVCLYV